MPNLPEFEFLCIHRTQAGSWSSRGKEFSRNRRADNRLEPICRAMRTGVRRRLNFDAPSENDWSSFQVESGILVDGKDSRDGFIVGLTRPSCSAMDHSNTFLKGAAVFACSVCQEKLTQTERETLTVVQVVWCAIRQTVRRAFGPPRTVKSCKRGRRREVQVCASLVRSRFTQLEQSR